jgi:hypothetical protein
MSEVRPWCTSGARVFYRAPVPKVFERLLRCVMISRLRFLLILFVLAGLPTILHAQWTTIFTASGIINSVKVLDQDGAPNTILVGLTGDIQISTDGGANFAAAKYPTFVGTVTDFSFMDADTGWASVLNNGSERGVMKTTDGGSNWLFLSTAPAEGNDVYFNKSNNRLMMSSATDSASYSLNFGATWVKFGPIGMTGFAFIDANLGILGSASTANGQPYYRTTDGGVTWSATSMMQDTWQPLGVPGTRIFFATDPLTTDQHMYESRDGGLTWFTVANYFANSPTGTVRGDLCSLYSTSGSGVFSSTDDGNLWLPIMMSPTNSAPTRFYVTATTVYAFNLKTLMTTGRVAPMPIHVTPLTVTYQTAGCVAADTVIRLFGCACTNTTITAASVTAVTPGSTAFSVQPGAIPRPLCGPDSIHIRFQPTSSLPDTADVHIRFLSGTAVTDTVIRVIGPGMPISVTPSARTFNIRMKGCQRVDTTLYLTNTLCNTLTLTQAFLDNTTHAQLNLPFALPKTISPLETIALPITANAIAAGTYNYVLTYQVTSPSGQVVTKDVGVNLLVSTTPKAEIRGLNWTVQDFCSLHDTAVYYLNTLCDTITLTGINLLNSSDFKLPSLTFPIKLGPGDYIRIPVTIVPTTAGTYSTKINFYGWIQDVPVDSTMQLLLKISKSLTPQATVSPNGAVFGPVSTCDSTRTKTLVFTNTQCVPLAVTSLVYSVPGDSTYTFPYHFGQGITLQPGDKDSIVVHFWPKINGGNGSIQVTYTYKSQTQMVTYAVSGAGSDKVTASLGSTTLDFDSLRFCDTKQLTTTLQNGPCADIVISSVRILSGSGFTVSSPKQGDIITVESTTGVTVDFVPSASGDITGAVEIQITDKSGQVGVSDTLTFTAHVKPPVRNFALGAIASDTLLACATRDTTLTLTNNGECDTIVIANVTSADPKVTITNSAAITGARVPVGQSIQVQVHFDPAGVTADLIGSIVIHASPDISIPYNIPVKTCATTPTIVTLTTPDSVFNTANCTTKTIEYTISVNVNSSTVDVITLEDLTTQFGSSVQIVGGGSLPIVVTPGAPLKFRVTYDPDAAGANTVVLHIHSTDGKIDRRITLTGVATGAPVKARLGVQTIAGGTSVITNTDDQKLTDLAVIMRDAVDPSVGLQTARFHMQYNKSVLTKTKITPMNGWTLSKDQGAEGDLDFTLAYSGAAISAGQQVATVSFLPALSTVTTTTVTIAQTHFNDNDPNFERCKLSLATAGDAVTVNIAMTCGDSIIQRALLGQPIVADLSIVPNPSGLHSATTISYKTFADADVKVEVMNLNGAAVAESFEHMPAGDHAVVLPSNTLRSGTYLVRITAGAMQKVGRFVVE